MKRSAALEPLSHDHYESLQLAARLRRALREGESNLGALQAEALAHGHGEMARHFETEEEVLLPVLQAISAEMAARLLREHEALRALLAEVEEGRNLAASLLAFAETLAAHVRFEEREAFPAIEASAGAEAMAELERRLHGRGAS